MSITPMNQIARPSPGFGTVPRLSQPPDQQGRFRYTGVPPGRYFITARGTGVASVSARATGAAAGSGGFFSTGGSVGPAASSWAWPRSRSRRQYRGVTLAFSQRCGLRVASDSILRVGSIRRRSYIAAAPRCHMLISFSGTVMGGLSPKPRRRRRRNSDLRHSSRSYRLTLDRFPARPAGDSGRQWSADETETSQSDRSGQ
jgi:hypothetical protein